MPGFEPGRALRHQPLEVAALVIDCGRCGDGPVAGDHGRGAEI